MFVEGADGFFQRYPIITMEEDELKWEQSFKCKMCNLRGKELTKNILSWSPSTHWLYSADDKRKITFLMVLHSKLRKSHPLLVKNIWYIIIRMIINDGSPIAKIRSKGIEFCDDCYKSTLVLPPCQYCLERDMVPIEVSQNYAYTIIDGQMHPTPAVCEQCEEILYTCNEHLKEKARPLCYRCTLRISYQDPSDDPFQKISF
tara:strand:- start:18204 stop:18809 length:606 start_codon:yes stop_codon:yes gene_type:complete